MKKHAIGIAALAFGVVALGLAVIPGIVLDRTPSIADEELDAARRPRSQTQADPEGSVKLEFKKFSVTVGRGASDKEGGGDEIDDQFIEPESEAAVSPKPGTHNRLLKTFTIAAVCCSLIGLTLGPISWAREKQPALSGSAMAISCLAIVWQYVVVGILIGVAIAVVLLLVSLFAS